MNRRASRAVSDVAPLGRHAWVTGTTGFLGRHLIQRLAAAGWLVTPARARPGTQPYPPPVPDAVVFHVGGLAGGRRRRSEFMAANCQLPLALYRLAARSGCRGFVFVSSAKVLGERCAKPVAETAPRRPVGAYAESKAKAEEALLSAHADTRLPLAIVRPPLVYGPGAQGQLQWLSRGLARGLPLPLRDATAPRSRVAVANLADALVLLGALVADEPRDSRSAPSIWHVTDGEDRSTADFCRALAAALGRRARLWRLPGLALAARSRGGAGPLVSAFAPFRLDAERLRRECGWTAPQTPAAALAETARLVAASLGDR